jgi:hypothetical protein
MFNRGGVNMRKLGVFVFILSMALFLSAPEASSFLFEKNKVSSLQLWGNVTNIDLRKSLITVTLNDGRSSTLLVESKTTFFKKNKKIGLSDLKKGDIVRIDYFVRKDQGRAQVVNVISETAKPKSKAASPKKKK